MSCEKKDINDTKESTFFNYFARKVQFVWADNIRGEVVTIKEENISGLVKTPLKNNSVVKISEYILGFSTCNVNISDIQLPGYEQNFLSDNYNPLYNSPYMALSVSSNAMTDEADPVIENKIKQHLVAKYSKGSNIKATSLPKANLERIDYRITPLKNIRITCSKDLFGVKAGEVLNDYFVVAGYPQYHDFIISSNKNLVSGKTTDISLAQYLSYQPMAPAAMYMLLKKGVTIPANVTAEFTVELELENDKTISATTKTITLTP